MLPNNKVTDNSLTVDMRVCVLREWMARRISVVRTPAFGREVDIYSLPSLCRFPAKSKLSTHNLFLVFLTFSHSCEESEHLPLFVFAPGFSGTYGTYGILFVRVPVPVPAWGTPQTAFLRAVRSSTGSPDLELPFLWLPMNNTKTPKTTSKDNKK